MDIITALIIAALTGGVSAGIGTFATVRVLSIRLVYIERDIARVDKHVNAAHSRINQCCNHRIEELKT